MSPRARVYAAVLLPAAVAGGLLLWLRSSAEHVVRVRGTIVPVAERDILSPIDAQVAEVHARIGDELNPGAPILSLDVGIAEEQARLIEQDLAVKTTEQLRAQLALQSALTDIDAEIDKKTIQLRALHGALANVRRLVDDGQGTEEQLEAATLGVQQAEIELAALQEQRWRLKQPDAAEVDRVAGDLQALMLTTRDIRQLLDRGTIRATRPIRVLRLAVRPGDPVNAGQRVARVADLTSFRVRLTLPGDVADGEPWAAVTVIVDDVELTAEIARDSAQAPGEVFLTLSDPSHPGLRAGRQVNVLIAR